MTYPAPGKILRLVLRRYGIPILALCHHTGLSKNQYLGLLSGHRRVNADIATWLHQAIPALPPEFWIQADALYCYEASKCNVQRRIITPLIKVTGPPPMVTRCICTHEQEQHLDSQQCLHCPCPIYLRAISVEAYLQQEEKRSA